MLRSISLNSIRSSRIAVAIAFGGLTAAAQSQVCLQDVFSGSITANDSHMGFSVDISGDYAVAMGVRQEVGGQSVGCPSVYRRDPATGHWEFMQALVPNGFTDGDTTGLRVAMDGDLIVVSSRRWNSTEPYTGALTVFRLNETLGLWVQEASLVSTQGVIGDQINTQLAINGNIIVADVGSRLAIVFEHDPSSGAWSEVAVLDPPRPPGYQVWARSVATNGDAILFAANVGHYVVGDLCSCVFAYERDRAGQWRLVQTISTGEINDLGLTMDMDRGVAIMAAWAGQNVPLIYHTFRRNETTGFWELEGTLPSPGGPVSGYAVTRWIAVDGDVAVEGDRPADQFTPQQGAAHIYHYDRQSRAWRFAQSLRGSDVAPAASDFGISVGVSDGRVIVGSVGWGPNYASVSPGAIHFFEYDPACNAQCIADIAPIGNPNGEVNAEDLLAVINAWGACGNPADCPADIAPAGPPGGGGNDVVSVDDLLAVINGWGVCP